ncbi:hypothetical protein ABTO68_19095, partial [Acinetobacter baumannii]
VPEMAVAVEAGSGSVSVARFDGPQPSRTIGMIWRKTNPLAAQFLQLADLLRKERSDAGAAAGSRRPSAVSRS